MCSLTTLLTLTALCAGMYFDMNYCLNVQCERDTNNGIAIKDFQGEMILRKHFGFCSNKKAIVLTFKYCKVEQGHVKNILPKCEDNSMAMYR